MHKPTEIACVTPETPMKEVVIKMTEFPLGAACVINDQKLVGVITDGDLRRELKRRSKHPEKKCTKYNVPNPNNCISKHKSWGITSNNGKKAPITRISFTSS